ncbi:hypothetical protein [Vibrio ordalii]|uniref:hypothetical protein n=1 Tax=Vibrio ordalii TaxID=28174 RepID=UPI0002FEFA57|nr:hypothetical protein [Vibrio ordalii]
MRWVNRLDFLLTSVTDEISSSITSIADASRSVSGQVNDVDGVLTDLSGQAETLNSEIAQFKYKN